MFNRELKKSFNLHAPAYYYYYYSLNPFVCFTAQCLCTTFRKFTKKSRSCFSRVISVKTSVRIKKNEVRQVLSSKKFDTGNRLKCCVGVEPLSVCELFIYLLPPYISMTASRVLLPFSFSQNQPHLNSVVSSSFIKAFIKRVPDASQNKHKIQKS